jgi:hypothetical protein
LSGFYKMHRGWQDSEVFAGAEYSERDAWVWLIEAACWQPKTARIKGEKVSLERGQMTFAQRFLAVKWGWSKSRVDRFLKRLEAADMVILSQKQRGNSGATTGATAGHHAGQGASILTICNYEVYQGYDAGERGNAQTESGATPFQNRTEDKEGKNGRRNGDDVGAGERASAVNLDVPMPDVLAIASQAARAAGVRHNSPQDIVRNSTLIREWQEAGADAADILAVIRNDRARPESPTITSLKYFDAAIRRNIAQQEANEHGTATRPLAASPGAQPQYRSNPALDRYRALIGEFDDATEADEGASCLHNGARLALS